ncbi:MAG: MazG nucleotide pyrophosphohydrolase domain-containing protein [Arthrobacter sp.]|uniref:MazG nucleotide pyrophosphohydrolase domain-containing protein n=1 Tax=Arthrobacter sp. TaxID=1667 RepID=UPI003489723D
MSASVDRLLEVVAALRTHCLWTAGLTHASLVEYLVEEAYELVESIEDRHPDAELKGELADVLLQVVLHASIAEGRGAFGFDAVADALTDKLVRRNTHVFTPGGGLRDAFPETVGEIIASWDAAKRAERPERTDPFEGLPRHLPALALADKAIERAGRWPGADPAPGAETGVGEESTAADPRTEEELGALLLDTVRRAHARGLDAERALRAAVARYTDEDWRASRAP